MVRNRFWGNKYIIPNRLIRGVHMPKKEKLIEPIRATMQEVIRSFFANDPKPRDPEKEKQKKARIYNLEAKSKSPDK